MKIRPIEVGLFLKAKFVSKDEVQIVVTDSKRGIVSVCTVNFVQGTVVEDDKMGGKSIITEGESDSKLGGVAEEDTKLEADSSIGEEVVQDQEDVDND